LSDESIVLRSEAEQTFLAKLAWIDRAALTLAARHGLDPDEQDDFAATVREKLIDDDYAAIRKHRGEATLETYLTIVIANHFKDYCVQRWGRWRPSAVARRAGDTAIRLEVLIHRDGYKLDSAIEALRSAGVSLPTSELRRLAVSFPARTNPRKVEQWIPLDATSPDGADDSLMEEERQKTYERAIQAVNQGIERLSPTDQLLLRLRIWEGMAVADIARSLNMDQKPLYRRIERCYKELRKHLEAEGVDGNAFRSLLDEP
jgi:RNA polymerase sigma factor for flagellar operon FliA